MRFVCIFIFVVLMSIFLNRNQTDPYLIRDPGQDLIHWGRNCSNRKVEYYPPISMFDDEPLCISSCTRDD